ncbi:unnamed protein product [Effrenium voratum]|uniref:Pentatricopeptide repeat-containing protein n=1 Tax=Effrenium voratum TaxID=2562239 RepID=A0AA36JG07_9DINO|nr:unnamed protein product [Effrenium voratum]CAJ1414679.1 unnamed protein product [Effrenium voratum]
MLALPSTPFAPLPSRPAPARGFSSPRLPPRSSGVQRWHAFALAAAGFGSAKARALRKRLSERRAADVLEAWETLRRQRRPSPQTRRLLAELAQATRPGRWRTAIDLLNKARAWQTDLGLESYKDLLKACKRDAQDRAAVEILLRLTDAGLVPDVEIYERVVAVVLASRSRGVRRPGRMSSPVDDEEMSELIEEMWDYIRESGGDFPRALRVSGRAGRLSAAVEAFDAMPEQQDAAGFAALMEACGTCNQPKAVLLLLQEALHRRVGEERLLFRSAITAMAGTKCFRQGLKLLEDSRARGLAAEPVTCDEAAIECCVALNFTSWIPQLLQEAYETLAATRDINSMRSMTCAYAKAQEWEFALVLLDTFPAHGIPRSDKEMNAVLQACFKCGEGLKALELFQQMETLDLQPDTLSCFIAILMLSRDSSKAAGELSTRLTKQGLIPRWIDRKTCINVQDLSEEVALVALQIFVEESAGKTQVRDLCVIVNNQLTGDTPEVRERKQKLLALLERQYGVTADASHSGEVRISRLELMKYGGQISVKQKTRQRQSSMADSCYQALYCLALCADDS